jgi:hypothetical protein
VMVCSHSQSGPSGQLPVHDDPGESSGRVLARLAERVDDDLILLIAHDGHDFAVELLDDLVWQWCHALVCPEDLAIARGNLRPPDVEVLVALGSVIRVPDGVDVATAGHSVLQRRAAHGFTCGWGRSTRSRGGDSRVRSCWPLAWFPGPLAPP